MNTRVWNWGARCAWVGWMWTLIQWVAWGADVPVVTLAFSPDGERLVANAHRQVQVRSGRDGTRLEAWPCDLARIASLVYSPDGSVVAAAGGEPGARGQALLLSSIGGAVKQEMGGHGDVVNQVVFDETGGWLATASSDGNAQVWRKGPEGNWELVRTLTGHVGPVLCVAFSRAGKHLITGGADRSLKVWSMENGRLERTLGAHTEAVNAIGFRPAREPWAGTPETCVSAADDQTLRVWQPELGRMVRIVRPRIGSIFSVAWARDGGTVYGAGSEGIIAKIDAASDEVLDRWKVHEDWIYALAVSPDGQRLASGDWRGVIRVRLLGL